MSQYVIFTDSSCDISAELLKQWGVVCVDLSFHLDGESKTYANSDMPTKQFYAMMRKGKLFRTAASNMEDFRAVLEPVLQAGNDILYIGFSSGLSNTVSAGRMAAMELQEAYPERKLRVIDTLCASAGEGLVLYYAVQKKASGASLEETAAYVEELLPHLCHWFTVDELIYLKRGGRISAASAFVGGVLNIKPVLHVDDEGHLINVLKVRGRKKAIETMAQKYDELALEPDSGIYYISHGDCMEDAKALDSAIFARHGVHASIITDVGPIIGAHSGPGTLALFFLGKHR